MTCRRREYRERTHEELYSDFRVDHRPTPEQALLASEDREQGQKLAAVQSAIEDLDPKEREVVLWVLAGSRSRIWSTPSLTAADG